MVMAFVDERSKPERDTRVRRIFERKKVDASSNRRFRRHYVIADSMVGVTLFQDVFDENFGRFSDAFTTLFLVQTPMRAWDSSFSAQNQGATEYGRTNKIASILKSEGVK